MSSAKHAPHRIYRPRIIKGQVVGALHRGKTVTFAFGFDGTLSEHATVPEAAFPHPVAGEVLRMLTAIPEIGVHVVSGRPLSQMTRLIPLDTGIELSCSHGREGRTNGREWQVRGVDRWNDHLDGLMRRMAMAIAKAGGSVTTRADVAQSDGAVYLECKVGGVAYHWSLAHRSVPAQLIIEAAVASLGNDLDDLAISWNNGHVEFSAPLTLPGGRPINMGSVIDSFPKGLVFYAGSDAADIPAVDAVIKRGGQAFAVDHRPDSVRPGTPAALLELVDPLWRFESVASLNTFLIDTASHLAEGVGLVREAGRLGRSLDPKGT